MIKLKNNKFNMKGIFNLRKITAVTAFFILLYILLVYKIYFFLNTPWNYFLHAYTLLTGSFLVSRLIISFFYTDEHKKKYSNEKYPSVAFIITCKNEEVSIGKTIDTCLSSEYPGEIECIAINDGSTDNTLAEMNKSKNKWEKKAKLKIISFPKNRGKREGMARGVLEAKSELIVFVDSDSFVKPNAVRTIVEHFIEDPKVGAVSGNSRVENAGQNVLTKMQSARYGVSYDIFKTAESIFGTVTCCPGCFSAYRRKAILKILKLWRYQSFLGTRSTFGDDRSLTNFVMRNWKVIYCRSAVATTIAPDYYRQFFKQQLRWKKSWIREGTNAGAFIWRKNPIASTSFYTNLLIPIFGPLIVIKVMIFDFIFNGKIPIFYLSGLLLMSLLFGIYYYLIYQNKYWYYVVLFTLLYTFILIWQMPYAIFRLRDTRWGTR